MAPEYQEQKQRKHSGWSADEIDLDEGIFNSQSEEKMEEYI